MNSLQEHIKYDIPNPRIFDFIVGQYAYNFGSFIENGKKYIDFSYREIRNGIIDRVYGLPIGIEFVCIFEKVDVDENHPFHVIKVKVLGAFHNILDGQECEMEYIKDYKDDIDPYVKYNDDIWKYYSDDMLNMWISNKGKSISWVNESSYEMRRNPIDAVFIR